MFNRDLWREGRKYLLPLTASIVFGALIGGLIVVQAWLMSSIISGVFLEGQSLNESMAGLIWLAAVVAVRSVLVYLREISAGKVSVEVRAGLKKQLFTHLLKISPVQIGQEQTGEIASTLIQGVQRLDAYFRTYLPQLGMAVLVPMIILVVVFPLDWLTGLIFLFTAPLIPLFMVLIGKEAEKRTSHQWRLLGRLSAHFLDVLQGLRTLKAFGLSKRQGRVIRSVSEEYARVTLGVLRVAFLSALALELLATISTAIVAVQIGLRLLYGQITFVESLFILILAPEFYFPLRQLGAAFHSGMDGIAAAGRIYALLETESELQTGGSAPVPALDAGGEIRFEGVRFAYQQGDRPSLRDVTIAIPLGGHTALVGTSGAGKSTIFSLLMGFIQPDAGLIVVKGVPLNEIEMRAWRAQVGWVPQFPYLFHQTVAENILVARPEASRAEVIEAAQRANADEFITHLPKGYDTVIGERGVRLSGGQAQRLAIARAFLKNARLLLLDEPASSLDVANTTVIHQALDALKQDRTVITISHQLSRVKSADWIVVLDQGEVVQTGTHEKLLAETGAYRTLALAGEAGQ